MGVVSDLFGGGNLWIGEFGFSTLHRGIGEFGSFVGYCILFFIP